MVTIPRNFLIGSKCACLHIYLHVYQVAHRKYPNKLCGRPAQYAPAPCKLTVDLLNCGVRVMCDMGYLCANFSLSRPLCSRLRHDVRDRLTDVRQTSDTHHRLIPKPRGGA